MTHQDLQNRMQIVASKLKSRLFPNRQAKGWVGEMLSQSNGFTTLRNARRIEIGLHVGSSDLIGATQVMITPEMVGRTVAVFTSCEIKVGSDRLRKEQKNWLRFVNEFGGIGFECREEGDLGRAVLEFTERASAVP